MHGMSAVCVSCLEVNARGVASARGLRSTGVSLAALAALVNPVTFFRSKSPRPSRAQCRYYYLSYYHPYCLSLYSFISNCLRSIRRGKPRSAWNGKARKPSQCAARRRWRVRPRLGPDPRGQRRSCCRAATALRPVRALRS